MMNAILARRARASAAFGCLLVLASCAGTYSRIMTYEQYRSLGRVEPFVRVGEPINREHDGSVPGITSGPGTLLYFGSAHFTDPDDPQAARIEWLWDAFMPDLALNEGGDPPAAPTREEAIGRYGEAGLLRFLAARDQVPIRSIDPTRQQEVASLLTSFTPEQLKVFFSLRAVAQDARREATFRAASPEACAENILAFCGRIAGLEGPPATPAELTQSCRRLLPALADWRAVSIDYFDPAPAAPLAFTNQIARTSSIYRDRYMVDLLETEARKHQRVFAVAGLSHLVMQEPELAWRFNGNFGAMSGIHPDPRVNRRTVYTSLLGRPLLPPPIDDARRADLERELAGYRAITARPGATQDDFVWHARTLGYLHRYWDNRGESVMTVCADGLRAYPDSYKLLRHRGHRCITIRRFDLAILDLSRAARIIEDNNIPDEVEPDGIPNPRGVPRSTSHTNIYYHLGLARYLTRDFRGAADAFRTCLLWSRNDDMLVAATHWLYCSLRRAGRDAEAVATLDPIRRDMEIFENQAYHTLCLIYKGEASPPPLPTAANQTAVQDIALAYGLANLRYMNDDHDAARSAWRTLAAHPNWPAFGVIAAEAEQRRD